MKKRRRRLRKGRCILLFILLVIVLVLLYFVSNILKKDLLETKTVIMYNQKDDRWGQLDYGEAKLEKTGCAITSLAMVASYLKNYEITPIDILEWSGDRYYVNGQGTSWKIFEDFAIQYNFNIRTIGIHEVINALSQKKPVIISVKPGKFTKVGHIMVLRGLDDNGNILINDPNDDEIKNHYNRSFTVDELEEDALGYWSFDKITS